MDKLIEYISKIENIEISTTYRIAISIAIIIIFLAIRPLLSYVLIKIFKITGGNSEKVKKNALYRPLKNFFLLLGIYIAIIFLRVPDNILQIVNKLFRISIILLVAYGITNTLKPDSSFLKGILKKSKLSSNTKIIGVVCNVLKIIVYCITGVIIISEMGYDINGLIAGLGLGGLTFALAAQDTAKNLFGGLVIFIDKPFSIGDWIETENYEGIIEDITFRSTRIRTWDDSIVTIPNSKIADSSVTNWTKMNLRRIKINIVIEYGATLKQICNFTNDVEKILREYDCISKDSIIVRFSDIADSGYNVFVCFKSTNLKFADYLYIKENVNYKLMQILEKNKLSLAYPSQTIYVKK